MNPARAALGRLALGFALIVCAALSGAAAPARLTPDSREILVMLRLSPDHYRPGVAYGGGYDSGTTASIRRRAAQRIAHRYRLALVENGWPMPVIGLDCYVMKVPAGTDIAAMAARVSRDPAVAWSQPMQTYRAQGGRAGADDPLFAAQPDATLWHLANLHRLATGRGVTVAIVDSKIDVDHPDLAGQFVADEDFVGSRSGPESHGTGIAGVIAAKVNGIGIVGVAPAARLMALRACWQTDATGSRTLCNSLSLARALLFAIDHHADVVNLSLAGPPDRLLEQLIAAALHRDITIVAAFDAKLPDGGFPASMPGVIAVGDAMAPLPADVYGAPGRDVLTTQPGGKWFLVNGSSYAAAHVSGLIALVRERRGADPHRLLVAATPTGGAVDACASVLGLVRSCGCACTLSEVAAAAH